MKELVQLMSSTFMVNSPRCAQWKTEQHVKEYPLTKPIKVGDLADDGAQLRPYIVMFGEC